jgi:hypothetical protein
MRRLKDYCRLLAWQTGVSYLLLWAVTVWALDEGATVFGKSGVCYPDEAKVLFYWVCQASSPLSILASVVNFALTATVWAPVYLAAATAQPDALIIAAPIVLLQVGSGRSPPKPVSQALPQASPQASSQASSQALVDAAAAPAVPAPPVLSAPVAAAAVPARRIVSPPKPAKTIKARNEFGLRRPERA